MCKTLESLVWRISKFKGFWQFIFWIFFVTTLFAWGFPCLENIKISPISDIYETITGLIPKEVLPCIHSLPFQVIITIGTIIVLVLWLYKRAFYLMSIRSMSRDLAEADVSSYKKRYYIHRIKIDLTDEMEKKHVQDAIRKIQKQYKKLERRGDESLIGFYGIAHTPLLFKLGFMIGDQSNVKFFHKSREHNSIFQEWCENKTAFSIRNEDIQESNTDIRSDELLVTISTTFEIKDNELENLHPERKHYLAFKGNNLDFDSVISYYDAEKAVTCIMSKIQEVVKKYGIKTIHMAISSSSAFTVFLGRAYSNQHHPQCIVYHFENGSYPWGISIKADAETCMIDAK